MPRIVTEGHGKCTMCNYRASDRYRLADEPPDIAICGDCFVRWLVEEGHTIQRADNHPDATTDSDS